MKNENEICGFCSKEEILCDSHILPAFLYRWLRKRSGTGYIRSTKEPNRRTQDGLKKKWLCKECENSFSRYERYFANEIFYKWCNGNKNLTYNEFCIKFCISISWRVLMFLRGSNKEHNYTSEQEILLDRAEARWRAFLNDEVPHPGEFEQHLLIFDIIESTTITDLPDNFNRFLSGAISLDIVGSDQSLMTFAKLGPFVIFGIIQKGVQKWEGTKVHVKHGKLHPDKITVPYGILNLLKEKSLHTMDAMQNISCAQFRKIDDHIINNKNAFLMSDQFKAILADAKMFGKQAVIRKV